MFQVAEQEKAQEYAASQGTVGGYLLSPHRMEVTKNKLFPHLLKL